MPQVRPYRGVQASARLAQRRHRFIEAGLDLLGGQTDPDELTVRAICARSGLSARYFYESFTDKVRFAEAVIDSVVARLAATTQAAVAMAPPAERTRAGFTNLIGAIAEDPRVGRLLFGPHVSKTALRKRTQLFTALSGEHIQAALRVGVSDRLTATANFVVGGVRQAITAWLGGEVQLSVAEFVDLLVDIVDHLDDPWLFRDR
jgi:AcrR family transcriptional regulator